MINSQVTFQNRQHAGQLLVPLLEKYKRQEGTIIFGLARGGVTVAYELSKGLQLPLRVVIPRKIGAPANPEFALGAIMEDGKGVFNHSLIKMWSVPKSYLLREIDKEQKKVKNRRKLYGQYADLSDIAGKTILLVDDGIATGLTMLAVIQYLREQDAGKIVVVVPIASTEALTQVAGSADEVFCIESSDHLGSVSGYYLSFEQTEDEQVLDLLRKAAEGNE